jgi:hypothetical protein
MILTLALVALIAPSLDDPKVAGFVAALEGDWNGTLEYRDYSNDKRVTLPTTLEARPSVDARGARLKFRYDEGKGRFVEGTSTLRVDAAKNTLAWESEGGKPPTEYALTGLDAFAKDRKGDLVLTGLATENGATVEARLTVTREGDSLTILKETRPAGGTFAFRNAYRFQKTPPKAG